MKHDVTKNTPVLSRLVKVQALTLLACFSLLFALQYYLTNISDKAALLQLRDHLQPKIEQRYEKWLTWKALGLNEALEADINEFRQGLPIASVDFIDTTDVTQVRNSKNLDDTIVLPQHDIPGLPLRMKVTLDKSKIPGANLSDRAMKIMFISLALVFIVITAYTMWYLKRYIHRPMLELTKRMHRAENGEGLNLIDLRTSGEIRQFADAVFRLHTKSEEAQKTAAIVQTVQMIAHDVRKPFSILRSGLEVLKTNKTSSEMVHTINRLEPEVVSALSSVNNMLQDILEVGSYRSNNIEVLSAAVLIHECVQEAARILPHKRINLTWRLAPKLQFAVDAMKMKRVLTNIIVNAFEATTDDGHVWFHTALSSTAPDMGLVITIGNSGSLIKPEYISKIFSPFFTLNKKDGTGLGLAIARKIVRAHEGELFVRSSEDAGTEFVINIALHSIAEADEQIVEHRSTEEFKVQVVRQEIPASTPVKSVSKKRKAVARVVVLDDNPFILDSWQALLGADIAECYTDPEELLKQIDSGAWSPTNVHCVISDYHFGDSSTFDGVSFAKAFKEKISLPVYLSSDLDLDQENRAFFDGVIPKCPINFEGLRELTKSTNNSGKWLM